MSVAHEVTTTCGKTVTVHGADISTYESLKTWLEHHETEIRLALNAIGAGAAVANYVRKK